MQPGRPLLFLTSIITLLLFSPAQGESYRWVDEEGVTHYSQRPPVEQESTAIKPPPPPATPPPEAWKKLNEQRQRLEDAREDRELATKKANEQAAEEKKRAEACASARKSLAVLEGPPVRKKTPEGDYRPMTDEEREAEKKKVRQRIKEFCGK